MQLSKYSLAGNFSKVGLGAKLGLEASAMCKKQSFYLVN
jgi:hypothetical protein